MTLSQAGAQQPGPPGPQVASPEVRADRRVTAWLVAPKADSVMLAGEILAGRPPLPMAKDARGVWTATVGPLAPGYPMRGDPFAFAAIQRDLLEDVLPAVERSFRVSRDPAWRAIMGLSLGGAQALRIGLANADRFHWVAGFSSALVERDPAAGYASVLAGAPALNRQLKMVRLTIGKDDFLLEGNKQFAAMLEKAGVKHTFTVGEGAHEWRVWRRDLRDILPLLFR